MESYSLRVQFCARRRSQHDSHSGDLIDVAEGPEARLARPGLRSTPCALSFSASVLPSFSTYVLGLADSHCRKDPLIPGSCVKDTTESPSSRADHVYFSVRAQRVRDGREMVALDEAFHEALVVAAGNAELSAECVASEPQRN